MLNMLNVARAILFGRCHSSSVCCRYAVQNLTKNNGVNFIQSWKKIYDTGFNANGCRTLLSRRLRWKSNGSYWNKSGNRGKYFFVLSTSWMGMLKYHLGLERPMLDDDFVLDKIKYATWCFHEKRYDEALVALHEGLFKAEERKDDKAINYCLDMMANVYYVSGKYEEAEKTFVSLIQRLVVKGDQVDGMTVYSPAIVELSLKLADIYALKGDDEKAVAGFEYCVATQKANVDKYVTVEANKSMRLVGATRHELTIEAESRDPYALYGLVLETYGRYLLRKGKVDDSLIYINRALEMAMEVYGVVHYQTLSLMNNSATLCMAQNRFDVAEQYLKIVVSRAPLLDDIVDELPGYFTNYAEALWHLGRKEEAMDYARRAANLVKNKEVTDETRTRTHTFVNGMEKCWTKEQKSNKTWFG